MKQTLTLARSCAPDHFIFWKLRTPSVTNHINHAWGIVTGNNSGQDARAAGDSNHRRPGESLVAHEAPVPLSFAPNAWPSSTVIQGYTFSRVSVPSKNSRRLRLRLRPRARRPCRCPPPPLTPRASRHRDIAAGTNTPRNHILPSSLSIATLSPACPPRDVAPTTPGP